MPNLSSEAEAFVTELDAAVEAHMGWTRHILRCVALHTAPPGMDVVSPDAHNHCRFGRWFAANREPFEKVDAAAAASIDVTHRAMHDAIRAICADALAGRAVTAAELDVFEQAQSELIGLLARFKTRVLSNAVRHDPLTGLPLRYGIEHDYTLYQKDARRNRRQLYVALIDIDHFKRINDSHGHLVGDQALRALAHTMRNILRANEPLYRFGGEEFLWLMQCNSQAEAELSAQRLLTSLRASPIPLADGQTLALTVTLGLARAGDEEELASAIERADRALYQGKAAGRDRYVVAP